MVTDFDDFTGPGEVEQWPQIGRGGHLRNERGEALVKVGNRHLRYHGGSDLWPFDGPYTGDPIHGMRGTWVHELTDTIDRDDDITDEFYAEGVRLGISYAKQYHIVEAWKALLAEQGWTPAHIEAIAVNDGWKVATNIDRVMSTTDGTLVVVDTKTASGYAKPGYLLQLAACVDAFPYNPTTGERGEWCAILDRDIVYLACDIAYLAWLPIGALIKADDDDPASWPTFTAFAVDLQPGRDLYDAINLVASTDVADVFQIAAPSTHGTAGVEQPAGVDVPSPSSTPAPPDTNGAVPPVGTSLDDLRTHVRNTWPPAEAKALAGHLQATGVDKTDPAAIRAAMVAVWYLHDVATVPAERPTAPTVAPPTTTGPPDEGNDVAPAIMAKLKADYMALDDASRSWIGEYFTEARRHRLEFTLKDNPTARRWAIVAGLVILADGFGNDDAVRACLHEAIGAEIAHAMSIGVGHALGTMNHTEADVFRDAAYSLVHDGRGMGFTDAGAAFLAPKAAA